MIVVDTNILAEMMKGEPHPAVHRWLEQREPAALALCAPVVMETVFGAERIFQRSGSRRLLDRFERIANTIFNGKVIPFDGEGARIAGDVRARRKARGRPILPGDQMIAAICLYHGATLATRNTRDFEGLDLKLVNPFEAA